MQTSMLCFHDANFNAPLRSSFSVTSSLTLSLCFVWEDCLERLVGFFVLTSPSFQHSKCTWLEDFFHFCLLLSDFISVFNCKKIRCWFRIDGVIVIISQQLPNCHHVVSLQSLHLHWYDYKLWRNQGKAKRPLLSVYRSSLLSFRESSRFNEIPYSGCFSCELDTCSCISTSCNTNQKVVENYI